MTNKFDSRAMLLVVLLPFAAMAPTTAAAARMGGGSGGMRSMPKAAMVLQQIHMVNRFEIKAAALARKKAKATLVKRYADRLWQDHHVADGKVKHLAQKLGYPLHSPKQLRQMMMPMQRSSSMPRQPPSSMPMPRSSSMGSSGTTGGMGLMRPMQKMRMMMEMTHRIIMKLQSASGPPFDQTYLKAMVKTHQKAIHMLQKVQSQKLDQPQVMHLAGLLIPILKQHLALAQHLQSRSEVQP